MAAWILFPSGSFAGQIGRIAVPLSVTLGLVALNRYCLSKQGFSFDLLGLHFRKSGYFFVGVLCSIPVVLAIGGVAYLFVPFHWSRGALAWPDLWWQIFEYVAGNSGEELMFRGYLLIVLWARWGLASALLIVALLFGVFHLPGLSGAAAVSMICTTAFGSYLFAFSYLLTGSLWTAFGLHVGSNVFLHHVFGLGNGKSLLAVQLHEAWPNHPYFPVLIWGAATLPFVVAAGFAWRSKR